MTIQITRREHASTDDGSAFLVDRLKAHGVIYETAELPHLFGWAGHATLIGYTSPRTGQPVAVLVVPRQIGPDGYAETYYYAEGMTWADALESEQAWIDVYESERHNG